MPNRDNNKKQKSILNSVLAKPRVVKVSKHRTCQIETLGTSKPTVNKKFLFISCKCLKMQNFPIMKL